MSSPRRRGSIGLRTTPLAASHGLWRNAEVKTSSGRINRVCSEQSSPAIKRQLSAPIKKPGRSRVLRRLNQSSGLGAGGERPCRLGADGRLRGRGSSLGTGSFLGCRLFGSGLLGRSFFRRRGGLLGWRSLLRRCSFLSRRCLLGWCSLLCRCRFLSRCFLRRCRFFSRCSLLRRCRFLSRCLLRRCRFLSRCSLLGGCRLLGGCSLLRRNFLGRSLFRSCHFHFSLIKLKENRLALRKATPDSYSSPDSLPRRGASVR